MNEDAKSKVVNSVFGQTQEQEFVKPVEPKESEDALSATFLLSPPLEVRYKTLQLNYQNLQTSFTAATGQLSIKEAEIVSLSQKLSEISQSLIANSDVDLTSVEDLINRTADSSRLKTVEPPIEVTVVKTAESIISELAKEQKYIAVVSYFNGKRSRFLGKFLWVPINQVEFEITRDYPSVFFGDADILLTINRLIELKVLDQITLKTGGVGYGVNQKSKTLSIFRDKLGLDD